MSQKITKSPYSPRMSSNSEEAPMAHGRSALVMHLRPIPISFAAALSICAGSANFGSRR